MASVRAKTWAQRQAMIFSGALDTGIWATKHSLTLHDPWYLLLCALPVPNTTPMCACTPHHTQVRTTLTETPELKVDACPGCQFTSCLCANEAKTFVWNVTATRLGEVKQRDVWQLAGRGVEFACVCMSGPDAMLVYTAVCCKCSAMCPCAPCRQSECHCEQPGRRFTRSVW